MGGLLTRPRSNEAVRLCLAALLGALIRELVSRAKRDLQKSALTAPPATTAPSDQVPPGRPTRPVPQPGEPPARMPPPAPSRPPPRPAVLPAWAQEIELWICLDFEWTCDEGPPGTRAFCSEEAEIIEFSFAVYDCKASQVVCEGQYYVKNQRTPITEFCTRLTQISDETLAGAGTLADALKKFEDAMDAPELRGRPTCAVAHGSADLELTLPRHCKAEGLKVPKQLRKYVDLRVACQRHVASSSEPHRRSTTLRDISAAMRVEMLGNEHCGLDDSWMVLLSMQQLLKANADLILVDIDAEHEKYLQGGQQQLCLDGIPYFAIEPEVRQELIDKTGQSFPEDGLTIPLGADGRPSGRAIADFGSFDAAIHALKALDCGKSFICGDWEGSPYGPQERILLARPLRKQEHELPESSIVPMPKDGRALAELRDRNSSAKGGGKGRGVCFMGRKCTRQPCRFLHPDGREADLIGSREN